MFRLMFFYCLSCCRYSAAVADLASVDDSTDPADISADDSAAVVLASYVASAAAYCTEVFAAAAETAATHSSVATTAVDVGSAPLIY